MTPWHPWFAIAPALLVSCAAGCGGGGPGIAPDGGRDDGGVQASCDGSWTQVQSGLGGIAGTPDGETAFAVGTNGTVLRYQ